MRNFIFQPVNLQFNFHILWAILLSDTLDPMMRNCIR